MNSEMLFQDVNHSLLTMLQQRVEQPNNTSVAEQQKPQVENITKELEKQYKQKPEKTDEETADFYFTSYFINSFLDPSQENREQLSKIMKDASSKNVDTIVDFNHKIQSRRGDVDKYFRYRELPRGYSVAYPVKNDFANIILNLDADRLVNGQQKALDKEGNPQLKIQTVDHQESAPVKAIWMTAHGVSYEPSKIPNLIGTK